MKVIKNKQFEGERPLFASRDLQIYDTVFLEGESPLKESRNIELYGSTFSWKYPLWYCKDVKVYSCKFLDMARSGIWYTDGIEMNGVISSAPKTFRRSKNISLSNCRFTNAAEMMWDCSNIRMSEVELVGDYFGMHSENVTAEKLTVDGNYIFDGGKNIEIKDSYLNSKDAFWNSENVVVRDSVIIGEYLGWNSKNVTFINCKIESNQGMCYMENVKLVNCELVNTDLAFEYSTVDAELTTSIDSVKNPVSGKIRAKAIGELILEEEFIDPEKTEIITEEQ